MLLPEGNPELEARLERAKSECGAYLARSFAGSKRLLDIGCGPAVTSVLLYEMLDLKCLFLMDGGPRRMREESWYEDAPPPWSDTALTRQVLKLNDVNYHMVEPDPDLTFDQCDAIMSLLSWGHHYPTRVYLPLARRSLPVGGKLVLDLRRRKDGARALLAGGFRMVALLDETEKTSRYLFEKVND